jgi:hypothetical protein
LGTNLVIKLKYVKTEEEILIHIVFFYTNSDSINVLK